MEDEILKLYKIKFNNYVCAILSEKWDVKEYLKGKNDKYTVEEFEGTLFTLANVKGTEEQDNI